MKNNIIILIHLLILVSCSNLTYYKYIEEKDRAELYFAISVIEDPENQINKIKSQKCFTQYFEEKVILNEVYRHQIERFISKYLTNQYYLSGYSNDNNIEYDLYLDEKVNLTFRFSDTLDKKYMEIAFHFEQIDDEWCLDFISMTDASDPDNPKEYNPDDYE